MGTGYTYRCGRCGHSVSTSGPWEFYRDSRGNRKPYGHPSPASEEAKSHGICGFSGNMYCPECDRTLDIILAEFTDCSLDYFAAWACWREPESVIKKKGSMRCPQCHTGNLIWDTTEVDEAVCPRCKEGVLKGEATWIA